MLSPKDLKEICFYLVRTYGLEAGLQRYNELQSTLFYSAQERK